MFQEWEKILRQALWYRQAQPRLALIANLFQIRQMQKQLKNEKDTAICVRGNDEFNHFLKDEPAKVEIDFDALERFKELDKQYKKTAS